ncbi:RNA polymerase Rpc34 [Pelagophyceae sp. CCMP2097]|nr:RNA polymerase Rpc34 [Pelagophyceae sp. CCMP2097]
MAESVKDEFLALLAASKQVSDSEVRAHFGERITELVPVINELLKASRLELLTDEGAELSYKLRDEATAATLSELTNEQLLVLQVVERSGDQGVWLRDIKNSTSMQQQTLTKALKVLEARKLVKTVRSVQQKTKKLYMAFDLTPTSQVSGGPWYTDQEFDHGFVEGLQKFVLRFVTERKMATLEDISSALNKVGIATVPLKIEDVQLLVDTLVFDTKLEEMRLMRRSATGTMTLNYKVAKQSDDYNFLTEVPCGTCPVRKQCHEGGLISPTNCIYFDNWLKSNAEPI